MPEIVERFGPLASAYDVLFCDVWGVVHNGLAAFVPAGDALARFRAGGGTVILITNAPRPGEAVQRILDRREVDIEPVENRQVALRPEVKYPLAWPRHVDGTRHLT